MGTRDRGTFPWDQVANTEETKGDVRRCPWKRWPGSENQPEMVTSPQDRLHRIHAALFKGN